MKLLWASLAIVGFSVMTMFSAPDAYTKSPEQAVVDALESPQGQAWLSSMTGGLASYALEDARTNQRAADVPPGFMRVSGP